MPTPSTRTPVRIARGSYSNLNGSVSDLQDGEISYAEDQDKLYIKEGGSLVALTYTPTSPAFTGTITGVNLTLSGNLTVNGTQTIINTQTLDVEDKQIEIGKVSSPSDTTADQGGIKLKGATDKTFLWVNATDAWTSSENIVLAANKRLLLGTTTEGNASADDLTIATTGNTGITIRSGTSSTGNIMFSDATSGSGEFAGYIEYNHSNNDLKLYTNGGQAALTLDSSQNATFAGGAGIGTSAITGTVQLDVVGAIGGVRAKVTTNNGGYKLYEGLSSGGTSVFSVTHNGALSVADTVSDSKGDLRTIVQTSKSSAHTIVASDSGKHSINSSGGWTFNTSTGFTAGQAITLINNSGSNQTVTNTGCTMYLAGDTSAKSSLTLKGRGMATFICTASNVYYGSGAGLE